MRIHKSIVLFTLLALGVALISGCTAGNDVPTAPSIGDTRFMSAPPGSGGGYWTGEEDGLAGARDPNAQNTADKSEPEREIEEADIVKVSGETVYALNMYRGLYIIDIADPDRPAKVGHLDVFGYPVEMYVRDDRVFIILSNYFRMWAIDAETAETELGSSVVVVDISDPGQPLVANRFHLPGFVTDTRIVGDVLYTVSNTYAWFWYYGTQDNEDTTTVTSINIGDPFNIHQVDGFTFARCQGWDNHVHVTTRNIYVASSCYAYAGYNTQVRYVDISDPAGQMALGAQIELEGVVLDRWALSEHENVFRIITTDGWWSTSAPRLHTFRVDSPTQIVSMAMLTLQIPGPEQLMAVRFDGGRAYIVTFERVDPLFTVDLSDPAHPVQAGELEIPGWVDHIVPRGNRLVAMGHDTTDGETNLAVSLFDVSDMTQPSLLARVSVGEGWGWLTDERDNFDKVFKVLDDFGLILLPFMQRVESPEGVWRYKGGVQLIDFTENTLTKRGCASHDGYIRRAFVAAGRLMSLSDQRFQVLDITDRDNPQLTAQLHLARNVTQFTVVGQHGVQLVGDWWAGETSVIVVPLSDPDMGTPVAELTLKAPYARLFNHGDHLFVLYRDPESARVKLQSVNLSEPADPQLAGSIELPDVFSYYGYYYGWWWWDYSWYYPRYDEVAQVDGNKLVFHAVRTWSWYYGGCQDCEPDQMLVVDLSNPDSPVLASEVVLNGRPWVADINVSGSTVYFTHYRWAQVPGFSNYRWVRFYLDRLDVSDPYNPVLSPSVNVPGVVLGADLNRNLIYTVDYQWVYPEGTVERSLNVSSLYGNIAMLRGRTALPDDAGRVVQSGDRALFVSNRWWYDEDEERYYAESSLSAADLSNPDRPVIVSETPLPVPHSGLYTITGRKAVLGTFWYMAGLMIYDISDLAAPSFNRHLRTQGWVRALKIHEGRMYVATGPYGVVTVPLE
jgi:hypothetical protein